ncbi:MAG: hypothetical protein B6D37_08270 [Sphingobacteriales bacterium UTBCD1]|jgi:hypothetical protein|nr:MAG: hypothetical protein B6D37_08270 [Sphingobacteriales bacterium UTBCD1]
MKMKEISLLLLSLFPLHAQSQGESEIQVYSSPITEKNVTFIELHSNYTLNGIDGLADPASARYLNESFEFTHGLGRNFEMGFYFFGGFVPGSGYQYLGSHIRPRYTVPEKWNWPFGASISAEFGLERHNVKEDFIWDGEIRPIIDKNIGQWYISFNPNMEFTLSGEDKHLELTPQLKAVFTIQQKAGVGLEYYGTLGTFRKILPGELQEHLLGPMIDLYSLKDWEINGGFLFGLTPNSNHGIIKLVLGHRFSGAGRNSSFHREEK